MSVSVPEQRNDILLRERHHTQYAYRVV